MQSSSRIVCVLTLCCLLVVSTAWAQEGRGRLEGRVSDESGEGIGAVAVVVDQIGATTLTDANGNYRFNNVAAGTYSMTFMLGDNLATRADVVVETGGIAEVDVSVDWQVSFAETITVVSASRRPERIVEAPAAVTLVTAEEIQRQASHGQVPKLLEFTPGAEVTQSGVYDYNLNTRGFNSSLTRRVATLIDGRDPSVPFLGAQEWAGIGFPLDDLASLELVRGPSAALYGANASSGVLNMITRAPRDSQEGLLRLTAGELSTVNADFRWAGELGSDWYVKLLGGARTSGDFTVSRMGTVEYPGLPQESVRLDPEDDDEIFFGSLRLDKHFSNGSVFTIEGGQTEIEGPAFQTGIGRVQLVDVERPWARANFNTVHWNVLGYFTNRDASKQTALGPGSNLVLDTERVTLEVQTNWDLGDKVRIVVGGSFTDEDIDSADSTTGRQTLVFAPIENEKEALFAQLDWNVGEDVRIVLAGRLDESDLHDSQFSPKASIVYSINPNNTLRFTYNEAFQVANYSEFFLQVNVAAPLNLQPFEAFCAPVGVSCGFAPGPTPILGLGNKDLKLEEIQTLEVGYSGILGGKAFLTVDYYTSDNENFITDLLPQLGTAAGRINPNFGPYQPPPELPAPLAGALLATLQGALGPAFFILTNNVDGTPILAAVSYTNFGQVDTQGVDIGLNYYFSDDWTYSFSYSWFDFDVKEDLPGFANLLVPNTPENKASFGLVYVTERWDAGASARWVDDFDWAVGPFVGKVESYVTVDFSANYVVNDHVKVGLNIANLFDDEHWEAFGGDILERRALGSITFNW